MAPCAMRTPFPEPRSVKVGDVELAYIELAEGAASMIAALGEERADALGGRWAPAWPWSSRCAVPRG